MFIFFLLFNTFTESNHAILKVVHPLNINAMMETASLEAGYAMDGMTAAPTKMKLPVVNIHALSDAEFEFKIFLFSKSLQINQL